MTNTLLFTESSDLTDLKSFLLRAKKLDEAGFVRLKTFDQILTVTVSPIYDPGILGTGPKVLGMRVVRMANSESVDGVFEISAILERLAALDGTARLDLLLPAVTHKVAWGGISAPQAGWEEVGELNSFGLQIIAQEGIAEVAQALGTSIGASISNKVRFEIWGREIAGGEGAPTAAAFALFGLGFLDTKNPVKIYRSGGWLRLTTAFGHVLVRSNRS